MDALRIKATDDTPEIIFLPENNKLSILGNSYPENTFEFYKPILSWLEQYLEVVNASKITFHINLVYINSSSSKALLNILRLLEDKVKDKREIMVDWLYDSEDEDSLEEGEDFKMIVPKLKFNFIEMED